MSREQPSFEADTQQEHRKVKYKASAWRRAPLWVKVVMVPLCAGFSGMSLLLLGLKAAPLPDKSVASPTTIEGEHGQVLAAWTYKGAGSERIPLSQIPLDLQNATIAVEDVHFYQHHAFNPLSVGRAMLVDATHGHIVQGGSTITQQLAKNLYLTQDRTMLRKVREALYALQLELHESKKDILNQYLNVVYYGHGAYGVAAAAHLYFNKSVENLDLAESSMLAGLPKGPSIYSPFTNMAAAKARQRVVLQRMVDCGFIHQTQAREAYAERLHLCALARPTDNAPYLTNTAISEVERRFHLSSDDLYRGGITVSTTLDPLLQQAAERAVATTLDKKSHIEAAVVALDPQTGAIKAMVGGRNYATSPYNRAMAERQPGSTFKAILYTAALSNGWTPARRVNSEMTTFLYDESKRYTVHDYGGFYAHRPLTLREALAKSDNVYAVTANLEVGPSVVADMAHKMGIASHLDAVPSLALGVCPTSPLQMATAYATLANGGYRITPYTVSEIRDAAAGKVYQTTVDKQRVVSSQVAFQMTDLLKSVLAPHGTAYSVHQYMHNLAAAKTGTTDTDAWMVGYTPKLVCAVWVGYDDGRKLTLEESHLAAPIWAKFMGTAQQHLPTPWYTPPAGVVEAVIDPATGMRATDTCGTTETDWYTEGTEPTEDCPLHPRSRQPDTQPGWFHRWIPKWL